MKQILPELGKIKNGTNAKARRLLGWHRRPVRRRSSRLPKACSGTGSSRTVRANRLAERRRTARKFVTESPGAALTGRINGPAQVAFGNPGWPS